MSDHRATLAAMMPEINKLSEDLLNKHAIQDGDNAPFAIAVATLFAMEAEAIWRSLGGNRHAAEQFYLFAGRCEKEAIQERAG